MQPPHCCKYSQTHPAGDLHDPPGSFKSPLLAVAVVAAVQPTLPQPSLVSTCQFSNSPVEVWEPLDWYCICSHLRRCCACLAAPLIYIRYNFQHPLFPLLWKPSWLFASLLLCCFLMFFIGQQILLVKSNFFSPFHSFFQKGSENSLVASVFLLQILHLDSLHSLEFH